VFAYFDLPKIDSGAFFGQLLTFAANISGTNKDIDKQLTAFSTTIDCTLNAEKLVDLVSLSTMLCLLISSYPTSIVRVFLDNFRL